MRRDRIFWRTLPLAVLALVAGVALVALWGFAARAAAVLAAGDPAGAETTYARQRAVTSLWPEPWKAPYNQGTARLLQGEFAGAREALEAALVRVPVAALDEEGRKDPASPECAVRRNLARAITGLAQEAGSGDGAAALAAEAAAAVAPCAGADDGDDGSQEQPGQEGGGEPTPSGEPSAPASPAPPDPRVQELEDRNQRAREEAEQDLRDRGGGSGGGQNW